MKKIKRTLMLGMLMLSGLSLNSFADTAMSWNLARDMLLAKESAPAGFPWAFMQNTTTVNEAANYTLTPNFMLDQCGTLPATCWRDTVTESYVAVLKANHNFSGGGGSFVFKQGDVALHPGKNSQTIIRWSSPIAGNISILGRVNDLHASCGDGIGWSVMSGDTVLQSGNLANGGSSTFSLSNVPVSATSSIYFVFDKKANYSCDATSIDVLIVK
ncbi:hypothetical protein K5D53_20860 [Pseudomonas cichorii]|nr:hypothetical protein [Pseudomonas cichorii]